MSKYKSSGLRNPLIQRNSSIFMRVTERTTHMRPLIRSYSDEKWKFVSLLRERSLHMLVVSLRSIDVVVLHLFDFAHRWCIINQRQNTNLRHMIAFRKDSLMSGELRHFIYASGRIMFGASLCVDEL